MNEHKAYEYKWLKMKKGRSSGLRIYTMEYDRTGRTGAGFYHVVDVSATRGLIHTWGIEFKDWEEWDAPPQDYEKVVKAVFE